MPLEYLDNLRDHDFNPWWGCTKVSPACDNCYAERVTNMRGAKVWGKDAERKFMGEDHWKEPFRWNEKAKAQGKRWNLFCGSLCDIMEEHQTIDLDPYREAVYWLVERTRWLNWMFFTKRPQNYRKKLPKAWLKEPPDNVWLITTVEHSDYLWRIDEILKVPAVVHGVISEPLLSPIIYPAKFLAGGERSWIMAGCERGVGRRSRITDIRWLRGLRDQAVSNDVPFFFNQWGEYGPGDSMKSDLVQIYLTHNQENRRTLDGMQWNEVPGSVWNAGVGI